jgi:hypothetical protein
MKMVKVKKARRDSSKLFPKGCSNNESCNRRKMLENLCQGRKIKKNNGGHRCRNNMKQRLLMEQADFSVSALRQKSLLLLFL